MKNSKRNLFAIGILLSSLVLIWVARERVPVKLPSFGTRGGQITVDSELLNLEKAVEQYKFEIRQKPEKMKNYVQLAQAYLQMARITGRHHEFVSQAQVLVDDVLKKEPENIEGLLLRAQIFATLHKFEEAREVAGTITERYANIASAWGIYSDALKELGLYKEAVAACDQMLSLRPDLRSYSRAAHFRELYGDREGAKAAMKLAVNAGVVGLESHAWVSVQLGDLYLNEGKLDTATYLYNAVLETRPGYPFALAGLARVASGRGEHDKAVGLFIDAYQKASEHQFMESLVTEYKKLGDEVNAARLQKSVLDGFGDHEAKGWNVNLEFANFCLEQNIQLPEALQRMQQEYQRRPNHLDVLEAYGWALYKNDRPAEGLLLLEQAAQMNDKNARLIFRCGVVARACDRPDLAQHYLRKSIALNPTLSSLEEGERSMSFLSKADGSSQAIF